MHALDTSGSLHSCAAHPKERRFGSRVLRADPRRNDATLAVQAQRAVEAVLESESNSSTAQGTALPEYNSIDVEVSMHQTGLAAEPFVVAPAVGNVQAQPEFASPLPADGGWVLALALVFAARLGRATAQEARLDVRRLQRDHEHGRTLSKDLSLRRAAWKLAEEERLAVEDARRVGETLTRTKENAAREAEKQRKYQEEAARESERLRAERDLARKLYSQEQARLDAAYRQRVEQEKRLLEEARERAKQAEEIRRQEREERERRLAAARMEREQADQRAREETARQKLEARRKLESEKQIFVLRIDGTVAVTRAPRGTILPGPLQKEASVRVAVIAGSLLGGVGEEASADFGSVGDAREALPTVVSGPARIAVDAAQSAMRLQALTGQGPLAVVEEPELQHWMAMAAGRTAVAALRSGETALEMFAASATAAQPVSFAIRTEYRALPLGHTHRDETVLARAVALVEAGDTQAAVRDVLMDAMQEDNEAFYYGLDPLPAALQESPRVLGSALTLAHLLGRMLHDRPAKTSDAPAWFEAAAALVRRELAGLTSGAPQDSLLPLAALLRSTLGPQHPVVLEAAALAESNQSAAQRQLRAERERVEQAALAEKLLAEEWPDEGELRAARSADKDAKTPVPERVWALRNVARTLAMGGAGERSKARQLLEQAVLLKQRFAGVPDHPGVLPELVALQQLLVAEPSWADDAAGVTTLTLRVLENVAAAYAQAGDQVSAAILLESALRLYEEAAGVRSQAVRGLTRRADQALDALGEEERAVVAAHRQKSSAVVARVAEALAEKLGAYSQSPSFSKVQEWDARGAAVIGPIRL